MHDLTLQRIPFSLDIDNRLRTAKSRTGITPNILCRMGFCLSLEEPGIPNTLSDTNEIGREINRYTLLGKFDMLFVALMKTWLQKKKIDFSRIDEMFIAHMNRGAEIVVSRVKSVGDIASLIQSNN